MWYNLTWQSRTSMNPCLLPLQCLLHVKMGTLWVSSCAAFQNKRIIVNRNVAWKMKLCGLNHHDFPRKTLVTLSDRWRRQVTHQRQRRWVYWRQNKHNPTKTSACVFALSCGCVTYTAELLWSDITLPYMCWRDKVAIVCNTETIRFSARTRDECWERVFIL